MNRDIIDVPLPFATVLNVNWKPDWRGQSAGGDNGGGDQIVYNAFPRWTGSPSIVLRPEMIGPWRAIISRGRGRVNAYRIRMIDPVVNPQPGSSADWQALQSGLYVEPRPQVPTTAAVLPGAASIAVDERTAKRPIPVGAILSYDDRPFLVEGRTGSGADTVLHVAMQRAAIPAGGQIDLIARGIFIASSDAMGWPEYDLSHVSRPQLDLIEWITR